MICPIDPSHGHMFATPQGRFDYYCPNKHGLNAEGALVNEVLEDNQWKPQVAAMIEVVGTTIKAEPHIETPPGPIMIPDTKKRKRRAK